jgi:ABC-type nitrate/sulfonate/bicarbonate transport system ATPase subunit
MTEVILSARAVEKYFGRTRALRGVSLDLARGEVLAVTGPSGSGKSTLLHCLSGILSPEAGEIVYDGQRFDDLTETPRTWLRRREFGIVFQFGQLVPELTVGQNVALPLLLEGHDRSEAYQAARAWLDRLDVGELAAVRPWGLLLVGTGLATLAAIMSGSAMAAVVSRVVRSGEAVGLAGILLVLLGVIALAPWAHSAPVSAPRDVPPTRRP